MTDDEIGSQLKDMISGLAKDAPYDDIRPIIEKIAPLTDAAERGYYCVSLSKVTNLLKTEIREAVDKLRKENEPDDSDENIILAHPSYHVGSDYLILGFRETIVEDNKPVDRNIYVVSEPGRISIDTEPLIESFEEKVLIDVRERVLVRLNDRWRKKLLQDFLKTQEPPRGVYNEIKGILPQYLEFQHPTHYGLVAAWTIGTYFHPLFTAYPFMHYIGPKGSGKTRALDATGHVSFNGEKVNGVSVAALGDTVDARRATFLIDQAERLSDPKNLEMVGMLAGSYTVGGSKRIVMQIIQGERHILEFDLYGPKGFGSTQEIEADLRDRCIVIHMLRAKQEYPYPEAHLPVWGQIRDKLYRLLLTRWTDVRKIYPTTGQGLSLRVRELWRPLETVLILEEVPDAELQAVKGAFLESMTETQARLTEDQQELFKALLALLRDGGDGLYSVSEIVDRLEKNEGTVRFGSERDKWRRSKETWVGQTLRLFEPYEGGEKRKKGKRAHQFRLSRVEDVLGRYEDPSS